MNSCQRDQQSILGIVLSAVFLFAACASQRPVTEPYPSGTNGQFEQIAESGPILLRLKAEPNTRETVDYYHILASRSFSESELRQESSQILTFTAVADTIKKETLSPSKTGVTGSSPLDRFTQIITVTKKQGTSSLHDFAMPELGEKLEVVSDSVGRILKAGEWPTNSIFYVPPISVPEKPVEVGDTWVLQASWLSLEDMVPYQLDMVSILKGLVKCGQDKCADIEVDGNITMQGPLQKTLVFRSGWRGRILFALEAGTVIWSRTDTEETFAYDRVHRTVESCLEATLESPQGSPQGASPTNRSFLPAGAKSACDGFKGIDQSKR